jgi:hypothetical protein
VIGAHLVINRLLSSPLMRWMLLWTTPIGVAKVANYIRSHASYTFQFVLISLKGSLYEKVYSLVGVHHAQEVNSSISANDASQQATTVTSSVSTAATTYFRAEHFTYPQSPFSLQPSVLPFVLFILHHGGMYFVFLSVVQTADALKCF